MKKVFLLSLFLAFALAQVSGQSTTKKAELNDIAASKAAEFELRKAEALAYARQHDIPVYIEGENMFAELMYIDAAGQPQYYVTHNLNAAATISTNQVQPGGSTGYGLDGSGMTLHEWDADGVLLNHQEYSGRVVQGDATTTTHYHSTHVAGTMIASGVNGSARGMAPAASLRAFDWDSDASEMASEAANGALVSNHSYGFLRGWALVNSSWSWYGDPGISTQEDYLFGFYDSQAKSWDNIAYNAPYYLIVKSAGNDRGDGPGTGTYPDDGPYDCISHAGVSKNILTVGAVSDISGGYTQPSDVVMSSFSAWGPADDGRIKPDIVANGVSLFSTSNGGSTSYTALSGTSMSSPSVAGSLILLQQHHQDLYGNPMLASTLKGLVIHTADEAGTTDGPDYAFGWGLMNTRKAADVITSDALANNLEEINLFDGNSFTRQVVALGGEPLKVTIAWTDMPGVPVAASLDPTDAMLVNDLDLRVTGSSNTYYPWKLDGSNPTAGATRNGENNVDNVEVVLVENPVAGAVYTITVDHDGSLAAGSQMFSLVVTGIEDYPPIAPTADFSASTNTTTTTGVVSFTDLSINNPTSWSWSFSPSSVSYINGTTENSRSPQLVFDTPGTYDVTLVASNAYGNDTETKTAYITVAQGNSVSLPWVEDFEGVSGLTTYTAPASYIEGLEGWSYDKTASGRLRLGVGPEFCYSGNYSATLDAAAVEMSINYLTVTLDLSAYVASTDLELSFVYMQHYEEQQANDKVWIRGSSSEPWLEAYDLFLNQGAIGAWEFVSQIDVDAILAAYGQVPGTTFQIRFGQEDNYPATSTTGSDGITIDDITLQQTGGSVSIISTFPYVQSWESNLGEWMQSTEDELNWTPATGSSASNYTGPSAAHDGLKYMYVESSGAVQGDEAVLEAYVDFTTIQNPELAFYYHMYGVDMGSLHVDVYDGSIWNNDVWMISGQQQSAYSDPYIRAEVDLSAWGGMPGLMIRFRGVTGTGYYSDIAIDYITIDVLGTPVLPVAEFTADNTSIIEGESVQFTDLSTNALQWDWTFVGGTPSTSSDRHPYVTYNLPGTYTVELTVTNEDGSDTETKTAYITVAEILYPPTADFGANITLIEEGESVQFTDMSTNNPHTWNWTFQGAATGTSTVQNPNVTYNNAGTYSVTLVAINDDGSDTEVKTGYITVTPALTEFEISFTDFETGWGIWTDGGSSCALNVNGAYAWSGTQTGMIYDDKGIESSFYHTNGVDIHTPGYVQLDIEFIFIATGMKNSRDQFHVDYYDGSTWITIANFACRDDFQTDNFYQAVISIPEGTYNFPTNMKLRFMNAARKSDKIVYIDDIRIIGSTISGTAGTGLTLMSQGPSSMALGLPEIEEEPVKVYPNPAVNSLTIEVAGQEDMSVFIYNSQGQQVYYGVWTDNSQTIDVSNFDRGLYVVKVINNGELITTRFLKQ